MDLETLALAKKYTKETMEGAGAIKGDKGDKGDTGADGFSPTITENENNTEDTYKLDITNKDGTFTTPNLKGQGGSGEAGTTDHNDLINRDMANQHPISAIEGLQEALDNVAVDLSDYATKEEVENSITEIETNKQDKLTEEQLQNIEDVADKANSIDVYSKDVADTTFIKTTEKGQANGVATLNNMGVIPSEQVNISSLNVKGTWNASTNEPALVNGVGTSGDFYITTVAGTVDFGAGEISFSVGDWALYTDSGVWEKSVNASAVQSVNGKTGLVNILDTDVLNENQLKAVNSGIDEIKVQQIETNKTDIAETKTSLEEVSMQVATNTSTIGTKLDKTTDVSNAGKSVIVGTDGNLTFDSIIDDTDLTSTTSTLSASKLKEAVKHIVSTQDGKERYVKFKLNINTISVTDTYGGKIEIIGANNSSANPTYKTAKVIRLSYGNWDSYDASQKPTSLHTKIGELYYYSVDNCYYLKLYNYTHYTITGLQLALEIVDSLPAETSEMTLIPESQYAAINDASSSTASTWSSSKISSEINPTIDVSKVFSNGTLNIATLCNTYGNGRYVVVGQGTTGNGSATIDIWTLASDAISYIVNVIYSSKVSNTFIGYTYENPTINFETGYLTYCNHIAKVCTLA